MASVLSPENQEFDSTKPSAFLSTHLAKKKVPSGRGWFLAVCLCCGVSLLGGLLRAVTAVPQMLPLVTLFLASRTAQYLYAPEDGGSTEISHGRNPGFRVLGVPICCAAFSICWVLSIWGKLWRHCDDDSKALEVQRGTCPKTTCYQEQPGPHGNTSFITFPNLTSSLVSVGQNRKVTVLMAMACSSQDPF